jgi:hypothetical protein
MIDCSKTENYFAEKLRMTKMRKLYAGMYKCELGCPDCPLSSFNNDATDRMTCQEFEMYYPEKAIEIVQKWSDEHPQKTYLTELLKIFPNTPLKDDGTPKGICLYELGATSLDNCEVDNACAKCWNQPLPEREEEEENDSNDT